MRVRMGSGAPNRVALFQYTALQGRRFREAFPQCLRCLKETFGRKVGDRIHFIGELTMPCEIMRRFSKEALQTSVQGWEFFSDEAIDSRGRTSTHEQTGDPVLAKLFRLLIDQTSNHQCSRSAAKTVRIGR